jgi:Skp family chaperone for outer membrane proteins
MTASVRHPHLLLPQFAYLATYPPVRPTGCRVNIDLGGLNMVRWNLLAAGAVVVIGAAFVTGASLPPQSFDGLSKQDPIKTIQIKGQKIGFFNMIKVMKEYKQAQITVQQLTVHRERMFKNLYGMREMYKELQSASRDSNPNRQEQVAHEMLLLHRQIEDSDRASNKLLGNQAATMIAELYDAIHAMTVEIAQERGISVVFAYPDAPSPEEQESPLVKELKLKPSAAQPFYIDPSVDFTDELIERLNTKYAAENGDN